MSEASPAQQHLLVALGFYYSAKHKALAYQGVKIESMGGREPGYKPELYDSAEWYSFTRENVDPVLEALDRAIDETLKARNIDEDVFVQEDGKSIDCEEMFARILLMEAIADTTTVFHPYENIGLISADIALKKYLTYRPGDIQALLLYARLNVRMGTTTSSHTAFQKVFEIDPTNVEARIGFDILDDSRHFLQMPPGELGPEWFKSYPRNRIP